MENPGIPEQHLQILFADNNPDLQNSFQEYCRIYTQASATTTPSAKETLAKTTSASFDILILSDNLSDMTLKEILLALQTHQNSPPVILFTEQECDQNITSDVIVEFCLRKGKQPVRKFEELISLCWEIAKKEQAILQHSEKEQQLHDIINFLPDPTLVINRNGVVIA